MQPCVSVILPVFNGKRYLRESIESVLDQSYTDFEFVICDDGSTDESRDIAASYGDSRVRFLANGCNQGLFATLNRLVNESRCELIRIWSQDDRMDRDCLKAEAEFWRRHTGLGMSYCGWDVMDESGTVVKRYNDHDTPEVIEPWYANQLSFYFGCLPGNIATVSLRKSVVREVGLFGDYRIAGDLEMWSRIMGRYAMGRVPLSLIKLRSHPGQLSRWRESGVICMKEAECAFARHSQWFPGELQEHIRRYKERRVYVQYFHHAVRAAVAMQWNISWETLSFLGEVTNPFRIGWWWLASGNCRWFMPRRIYREPPCGSFPATREECV